MRCRRALVVITDSLVDAQYQDPKPRPESRCADQRLTPDVRCFLPCLVVTASGYAAVLVSLRSRARIGRSWFRPASAAILATGLVFVPDLVPVVLPATPAGWMASLASYWLVVGVLVGFANAVGSQIVDDRA